MISSICPISGQFYRTAILYSLLIEMGFSLRFMDSNSGDCLKNYLTMRMSSTLLSSISRTKRCCSWSPIFLIKFFLAVRILSYSPPVKARDVSSLLLMLRTLRLGGECIKYLILLLLTFYMLFGVLVSVKRALRVL